MRLQHVGITVPAEAFQEARGFYGGILGLPELSASERALVYGLGRTGSLELHVIAGDAADPRAEHHFALEVADLDAARSLVETAGHTPEDARAAGAASSSATRSGT